MNPRLRALMDRKANIVAQCEALLDAAHNEDRDLTDAENETLASLQASIAPIDARMEVERRLATQFDAETPRRETGRPATSRQPFASMGEQFAAIIRAGTGRGVDPRLVQAAATGMGEQSPTDGGFLLQPEFTTDLLNVAFDTGLLVSRVRRLAIGPSSNQLKYNTVVNTSRATGSRYGALQLYWPEEGGTKTASSPKLRQKSLTLKKLIGLVYATDELLEDATALESFLSDAFGDEFGFALDDVIVRGTGVGQPLGWLNADCTYSVAAEGGQTSGTVNLANILKMYQHFWGRGKQGGNTNPVWAVNAEVMPQLMQLTLGGTSTVYGAPVFLPANGVSGKPYATLMGIPLLEIEQASALGTVGDINLVDLSQYLMIDKGAMKTNSSIHVRFINDETAFRFVYRCDGAPLWDSTVSAYKGTNTISPFITLAAR